MVEISGSAISRPAGTRLAVIAAIVAVASLALSRLGVPLALGIAGYLTIRWSKANQVLRGRVLSAAQHRRAAIAVGGAISRAAKSRPASEPLNRAATAKEAWLCDRLETEGAKLRLGETVRQCEEFACASATVIKPATDETLEIAELHGFALNEKCTPGAGAKRPISRARSGEPNRRG